MHKPNKDPDDREREKWLRSLLGYNQPHATQHDIPRTRLRDLRERKRGMALAAYADFIFPDPSMPALTKYHYTYAVTAFQQQLAKKAGRAAMRWARKQEGTR